MIWLLVCFAIGLDIPRQPDLPAEEIRLPVPNLLGYHYLDGHGNVAIGGNFLYASSFENNRAIVQVFSLFQEPQWGIIDRSGQWVLAPQPHHIEAIAGDRVRIRVGDKRGVIDMVGRTILDPIYDYIALYEDGYLVTEQDDLDGLFDFAGNEIIPAKYEIISYQNNGFATLDHDGLSGWYFIPLGILVEPQFGWAYWPLNRFQKLETPIDDVLIRVSVDGQEKYADIHGAIQNPYPNTQTNSFLEGRAFVPSTDNPSLYGVIDTEGKWIVEPKFALPSHFEKGKAIVAIDRPDGTRKFGVIDRQGKEVVPFEFDEMIPWINGYSAVEKDGKFSVIDRSGRLLTPLRSERCYYMGGPVIGLYRDDKTGILDLTGNVLIPPIIEHYTVFDHHYGIAKMNDQLAGITPGGQFFWGPKRVWQLHGLLKLPPVWHYAAVVALAALIAIVVTGIVWVRSARSKRAMR